jgi:hypothetical protein
MKSSLRKAAAIAALSTLFGVLSACGGGGSSSPAPKVQDPPPPPVVAPAAPQVTNTMRAKRMTLQWAEVATATSYRIMRDADGLSGFTQWGDALASSTLLRHNVLPVHLLDWMNSRYRVEACNAAGCTRSTTIFLSPADQHDATGYFKATNTSAGDLFGYGVALSADGRRMAISAVEEGSGVPGTPGDDSAPGAGAVYVFSLNAQDYWVFDGYLKAANPGAHDHFGLSLALNSDGTTLVVGAPAEDSATTGINGDATDDSASDSGAAYVFVRGGAGWTQQVYLKASNAEADDEFGWAVSLSDDGGVLAIGAPGEDSSVDGIGGNQNFNLASRAGAAYLFTRSGSTWSQAAYVKASNSGADRLFGRALALSRDGLALAVTSPGESSGATGIDGSQSGNTRPDSGAAYVFRFSNGTWAQEAYVKASRAIGGLAFGISVAFNGTGTTLAVGAVGEDSAATGIDGNQDDVSATNAGAVYVFQRDNAVWAQQSYIKASNTGAGVFFGYSLALSEDGNVLAAGAPMEQSNAHGIGGNQADVSMAAAGAAYVFTRNGVQWTQRSYVKGHSTDSGDFFGRSLALRADGETLAVGTQDDSNAVGEGQGGFIETRPADNSAPNAGSVFLY